MQIVQLLNLLLFLSMFVIVVVFGLKAVKAGKKQSVISNKEFLAVSLFMTCFGLVFSLDIAGSFLEVLTLSHASGYMRLYVSGLGLLLGHVFLLCYSFIFHSKYK